MPWGCSCYAHIAGARAQYTVQYISPGSTRLLGLPRVCFLHLRQCMKADATWNAFTSMTKYPICVGRSSPVVRDWSDCVCLAVQKAPGFSREFPSWDFQCNAARLPGSEHEGRAALTTSGCADLLQKPGSDGEDPCLWPVARLKMNRMKQLQLWSAGWEPHDILVRRSDNGLRCRSPMMPPASGVLFSRLSRWPGRNGPVSMLSHFSSLMHLSTASPRFGHGRGPLACVARNFAAKGLGPIQFQGDGNHVCIYIYI